MMVDEITALAGVLSDYQRDGDGSHAVAQLAIALTRVVEKLIKPALQKKFKPQDVDDVCSEIILGFWKFRHSVRPDEVDKLISTLSQRKQADLLRRYYKDREHKSEASPEQRELLDLLPAADGDPEREVAEDTWNVLSALGLNARDHIVAFLVAEGVDKQVAAEVLGIDATTITRSLKRCRQVLEKSGVNAGQQSNE